MASAAGRGAQVRLRGPHQAAARGTAGLRLIDNILLKRGEEEEGRGSDGLTFDGATRTGIAALDEVLTPGGLWEGIVVPSGPGSMAGSTSITTGLSAGPLFGQPIGPGGLQGFTSLVTTLSGTLRGTTSLTAATGLNVGLSATPLLARGALAAAEARISTSAFAGVAAAAGPMQGSTGLRMQFGTGMFGETGLVTALSGTLGGIGALVAAPPWVEFIVDPAAQANSTEGQANSTAGQANTTGVTGSSERVIATGLQSANLRGIGRLVGTAAVNFSLTGGDLTGIGTPALPANTLTGRGGEAIVLRDGQMVEVRQALSAAVLIRDGNAIATRDGTEIELRVPPVADEIVGRDGVSFILRDGNGLALRIMPDQLPAVPPEDEEPDPGTLPPPPPNAAFFQPFNVGGGVGALTHTWGSNRFVFNDDGTVTLDGSDLAQNSDGGTSIPGCGMMTPNNPGVNDGTMGFGNGRYEFRVKATGPGKGDGSGPAAILWPADDVWPGSEVRLFERLADGRSWASLRRRHPDNSGDDYLGFVFQDHPALASFDAAAFSAVEADLFTSVFRLRVNGVLLVEVTDPAWLPKDYLHGGVNHAVGLTNRSTNTSLTCDFIRFTPEASIA